MIPWHIINHISILVQSISYMAALLLMENYISGFLPRTYPKRAITTRARKGHRRPSDPFPFRLRRRRGLEEASSPTSPSLTWKFFEFCRWESTWKRRREHQHFHVILVEFQLAHGLAPFFIANLVWYSIEYIGFPKVVVVVRLHLGHFAHSIFPGQFHCTLWGGTYGCRGPGWSNHCLGGGHWIYNIIWMFPKIGTPKSSILIGFSIINHPFWGTTILGNPHIHVYSWKKRSERTWEII